MQIQISHISDYVLTNLVENAGYLLDYFSDALKFFVSSALVRTLLTVFRFNSQCIPVSPACPMTNYFEKIFPFLARLNHSCSPNCLIVVGSIDTKSANELIIQAKSAIIVKLMKLIPLNNLDELTIN